jgi:hypothetical protein
VLSRPHAPSAIYLSRRIPYADAYWRFYALAAGRPELVDRPAYVEPGGDEAGRAPTGALMVTPAGASVGAEWKSIQAVTEPNGVPSFVIFERR